MSAGETGAGLGLLPGTLAATATVRKRALALSCAEHDAAPGEYCWPRAGGLCRERVEAATRAPALPSPHALRPGELEHLAQATRRAQRDARLRTDRRNPR